jgi:hypothetical protein
VAHREAKGHRVRLALRAQLAQLVRKGIRDFKEHLGPQDRRERRDFKGYQVLMGRKEVKGIRAQPELERKARKELLDLTGRKALKAFKDSKAQLELGRRVLRAIKETKEIRVFRVRRA